ncbi:MAG: SDR family oxidoreductase [Desulfobulbaceae bacterium]|nr:MAG: SDR family oxidoreductase [Desulfobulbaceae bacterium]
MKGKLALVTGGSQGIGAAIVHELSTYGCRVIFNYLRNHEKATELVDSIRQSGGFCEAYQVDFSNVGEISTFFKTVAAAHTSLDILVNNAGIMINTPIADVSEEEFDQIFDLNVKGLFFSCREAIRIMNTGGSIINIGTTVTKMMLPGYGTYAASKGAVEQITRVLAKELGPRGIRVNCVSPGPTDTSLFRRGKTEQQVQNLASMSAFNRIGTPEEIAQMVRLLCTKESGWVSGQNIFTNGGLI